MKIIGYFLGIMSCLSVLSCKDFLKEDARSDMTAGNFYQTEADAEAAIVAAYDLMNNQWDIYYRGIYLLAELPTDNATCGVGVANANIFALDDFTFGPVNDRINVVYTAHYAGIKNANAAIDNIPAISFNEAKKNRLLGEAHFIRALLYYNLVRLFGDVPLVLHQATSLNEVEVERAPVEEVYQQIVADLTFAEENLDEVNNSANIGRATKASAKAILASVHLTRKEYAMAKTKAEETLSLSGYGLEANYFDIFTPENKQNREFLFAVQNKGMTGTENGFGLALFLPRATIPLPGGGTVAGNSADVPTEEFYDSFSQGDLRRDRTFFTEYDAGAGRVTFKPHWYKYFDPGAVSTLGEGNLNYAVIRYAEVLLIEAEATNELEGPTETAYQAINQIRRRAYGLPINLPDAAVDLNGLSQSQLREAILAERRWEFGFEGIRWFDLVRTGKLQEVLQEKGIQGVRDHHNLFPLPQRELDVNKLLVQNPGYAN
ncbi:RagB/SusD family nutrient uptake outer membrane protein [Olivibacter sp. SDN3]|uniref:RagB/SusD family nutrient uptake outer membrane protein n=1 Tax=Olivibacter sp. SDN3 TaxID=2764720 RepID=UPI001650DA95|nr:RagB/SusD family nutrient uptake outer membrane protein [Olivibacter sp. SDN3]QNL48177.1 RagB/SusD family nutrient uptake outer membrane protein [Olivibacter sp. SDN3]